MEKEDILEKLKKIILSWDSSPSEYEIWEGARLREDLKFDHSDVFLLMTALELDTGIDLPGDLTDIIRKSKTIGDIVDCFWRESHGI